MENVPTLEVALRVLSTISLESADPDPRDVEKLHELVPGHSANEPIDELARTAIQEALRRPRAKAACKE